MARNMFAPKAKKPGSDKFPQGGAHNPNVGTRGKVNSISPHRVPAGTADNAAAPNPPQRAASGLDHDPIGQPDPHGYMPGGRGASVNAMTRTPRTNHPLATKKPKRKGIGAAFYGEY